MAARKRPSTGHRATKPSKAAKPTSTPTAAITTKRSTSKTRPAGVSRFGAPVAAYDSGALVELRLAATGNAQVLVFLNQDAKASKTQVSKELGKHFSVEKESQISALAAVRGSRRPSPFRFYSRLGVVLGTVNSDGFKALRQREGRELVAAVHAAPVLRLIRPVRVAAEAAPPQQQLTWGLQALQVDQLWAQGITGKAVVVAHLDTGVDGTHPALQGAIQAFAWIRLKRLFSAHVGRYKRKPAVAPNAACQMDHVHWFCSKSIVVGARSDRAEGEPISRLCQPFRIAFSPRPLWGKCGGGGGSQAAARSKRPLRRRN
jgi:subtilisin family serine protease